MDGETRVLISHLSPNLKRKVKEALRDLAGDPNLGKPLQDELSGLSSYRIGRFRIIYQVHFAKRRLHLITIGPRKTVYRELARDLKGRR